MVKASVLCLQYHAQLMKGSALPFGQSMLKATCCLVPKHLVLVNQLSFCLVGPPVGPQDNQA